MTETLEISLREITEYDTQNLVDWRNDPENSRWFPEQDPWTVDGHLEWYWREYLRDPSQNLYLVRRGGTAIGTVGMTIRRGSGELERMMLGNKTLARGGYMRKGMRMLMHAYGLDTYWLRVMPDNEATIAFHERNGFKASPEPGAWYRASGGRTGRYLVMSRSGELTWDAEGNDTWNLTPAGRA